MLISTQQQMNGNANERPGIFLENAGYIMCLWPLGSLEVSVIV